MSQDEFLSRNRINDDVWAKARIEWSVLDSIACDYKLQLESLSATAKLFAEVIQRFTSVHSVRWRVKDVEHLLSKIIRKRASEHESEHKKYSDITASNYFEKVSDLVGIRALHLFKDDCFEIDTNMREKWDISETPTAYIRNGDPDDLTSKFGEQGFDVKLHPAGYRSVHYVCSTKPLQRTVLVEVQVRTIFEEGWSEIDHQIRYPNFDDNELVSLFLANFNRLAGSSDEMGSFVKDLSVSLRDSNEKLHEANRQKDEASVKIKQLISELMEKEQQNSETTSRLLAMQNEVEKLNNLSTFSAKTEGINSRNFDLKIKDSSDSNSLLPELQFGMMPLLRKTQENEALTEYLKSKPNPILSVINRSTEK